ncbi:E3 ubiquitin-protein ligase TRIM62-like [Protopterus annectens]|uniref:E3 ubiquitin-protein ligase TRIM62-like n=1 Tax=Protopterus annectens TaxID=7888 RepID=UPI001CFBFE51|nr:E3 ubiquitin-protein ligase TRIM62-like [Protopterus annectens]
MANYLEAALSCSVCLGIFRDPAKLQCGHTFCKRCLEKLWKANRKDCPECRSPFDGKFIPDYALKSAITYLSRFNIDEISATCCKEDKTYLNEVNDSILTAPEDCCIAVCVNEQLTMRGGVSRAVKDRFGRVVELKKQGKKTGEVAVLEDDDRFLYYLVTRSKFAKTAKYEDLQQCLHEMKTHCVDNYVTDLAIPSDFHACVVNILVCQCGLGFSSHFVKPALSLHILHSPVRPLQPQDWFATGNSFSTPLRLSKSLNMSPLLPIMHHDLTSLQIPFAS